MQNDRGQLIHGGQTASRDGLCAAYFNNDTSKDSPMCRYPASPWWGDRRSATSAACDLGARDPAAGCPLYLL